MKILVCGLLFGIAFYHVYGSSRVQSDAWAAAEGMRAQAEFVQSVANKANKEKDQFKERTKEIVEFYNSSMKETLETEELDPNLSLKDNIAKLKLKVVRVKNLNEAKAQAEKRALNDKNYVVKQINNSNKISLYEINESAPFYSKDGTVEKSNVLYVKSIKDGHIDYVSEPIITKYPDTGLANERYYKYITRSKNKKEHSDDFYFEEGGIIFVDESMNLEETKPADIFIVSISAPVSEEAMIAVVKDYNSKFKSKKKSNGSQPNKNNAPTNSKTTSKTSTSKQLQ